MKGFVRTERGEDVPEPAKPVVQKGHVEVVQGDDESAERKTWKCVGSDGVDRDGMHSHVATASLAQAPRPASALTRIFSCKGENYM